MIKSTNTWQSRNRILEIYNASEKKGWEHRIG